MNCRIVERVTFQQPNVLAVLRAKFVESRLHMDEPERDPAKYQLHRRLQMELIGGIGVPHYAILDPVTGEFLYRTHLYGADPNVWRDDFMVMFAALPPKI